jgi:retron-type reverse transcriptase
VRVKINNKIGRYIKSYKGVGQGDPLSPILFNFIADSLARMIHKSQENDLITRLCDHIIPSSITIYSIQMILSFV